MRKIKKMQQTLCISSQGLQYKNKKYKGKSKATRKFFLLWLCFSKEDREVSAM